MPHKQSDAKWKEISEDKERVTAFPIAGEGYDHHRLRWVMAKGEREENRYMRDLFVRTLVYGLFQSQVRKTGRK